MLVPHFGDLGRGRRHGGRRGGMGPYYMYPPAYYYQPVEEPVEKYVILNPQGKGIALVVGVPRGLPKGHSFRVATASEAALNKPLSGFGAESLGADASLF